MARHAAIISILFVPSLTWAQQSDPTASTSVWTPFIVAAAIAYLTRRMAIGGWLFYFYIGILVSPVTSLVLAYPDIGIYFYPSQWYDLKTYWLSFFSYVPWLVSLLVVFLAALRLILRSQRNRANAQFLRRALLALAATGVLGWVIELNYWPEYALLSGISTFSAGIICLYFFTSKRVRYVFDNWSGKWSYEDFVDSYSKRPGEENSMDQAQD